MAQPPLIDAAGSRFLNSTVKPPFTFHGVTARGFPLRANMARLTQFCDSYLNMDIKKEIVYFRPALPYVYLIILNYGSMAPASVQARNFGWVAQNEVTFLVMLEKWHLDKATGKLKFDDWVNVSPFIFVDSQLSLATGREVYGWPKVLARVEADIPLWDTHPRSPSRLFSLSIPMFREAFAGEAETHRVLIQIDYNPSPTFAQFPPDLNNPLLPFAAIPNAVRNSLSLMGDAADWLLGLRVRGITTNRDLTSLLDMGKKAGSYIKRLLPEMLLPSRKLPTASTEEELREGPVPRIFNDSVTLKQFRDPEDPSLACYKALVSSRMGIDRVNKVGLLGDLSLLSGDPSGGYTIRINRYTVQPIIESLGIEVDADERGSDDRASAILKPVFPFWTDVDLYYAEGNVICSRANFGGKQQEEDWIPGSLKSGSQANSKISGLQANSKRTGETKDSPQVETKQPAANEEHVGLFYNTAQGAATQPVVGPFHFPDVTVQVYPLMADQATLDNFLRQYLNDPLTGTGLSFKTFGSYVYLMINVHGDLRGAMWSSSNNIGCWAEREVSFCVPIKWYHKTPGGGNELISAGMIEPFVYANNVRAVITDREVNGRPSVYATIDSPHDVWLSSMGPDADRRLLCMETDMFPALGLGQKAQLGTLIEIDGIDALPEDDEVDSRMISETWGPELIADLRRKINLSSVQKDEVDAAKALALEILVHGAPINRISLKQYRDANEVDKACYQSLVHTPRSITRLYEIGEILPRTHVRLHRVPGHPIAEVLGLKIKSESSGGGKVVDNIQPIRPFWMHIEVEEKLGRVIATVNPLPTHEFRYLQESTGDSHAPSRDLDRNWVTDHPWFADDPWSPADKEETLPSSSAGHRGTKVEVDAPYFRATGDTRVACSVLQNLAAVPVLDNPTEHATLIIPPRFPARLELNEQANNWLRKSLTYQLAFIKSTLESDKPQLMKLTKASDSIESGPTAHRAKASDHGKGANSTFLSLDSLMQARSVSDYCAANSVDRLIELVDAIPIEQSKHKDEIEEKAKPTSGVRGLDSEPVSHLEVILNNFDTCLNRWQEWKLENWTSDKLKTTIDEIIGRLERSKKQIEEFSENECRAAELSMGIDIGSRIEEWIDGIQSLGKALNERSDVRKDVKNALEEMHETLFDKSYDYSRLSNPIVQAVKIVEEVERVVSDWENLQSFRRLQRECARKAIDKVVELQVVLESILSNGWANGDDAWKSWDEDRVRDDRYSEQNERWLQHRFPVGSVTNEWAEKHRLLRLFDPRFGNSWVVPKPRTLPKPVETESFSLQSNRESSNDTTPHS
jgi:hypothetical protein